MPSSDLATTILDLIEAGWTVTYDGHPRTHAALGRVTVWRYVDGRRIECSLAIPKQIRTMMAPEGALRADLTYARRGLEEALSDAMD